MVYYVTGEMWKCKVHFRRFGDAVRWLKSSAQSPMISSGSKCIPQVWCECVQVHPTGLVLPDVPEYEFEFFEEEEIFGDGGLVFGAHGNRLANVSRRRDNVTVEMFPAG